MGATSSGFSPVLSFISAVPFTVMILRSQAKFASKSENTSQACGITTRSHKRSVSRGVIQKPSDYSNQSNAFESEEDTHMEDQAILDMQAADECMDQVHICDGPGWKVVNPCPSSSNASEECPVESMSESVTDGLGLESGFQSAAILKNYQYREQHNIMFFKLCPKERRWLDLGPCIVTAEGELYRSTVTVRMEKTFRILATWSIFGGMKVVRFLSTVIVLAIVSDDEGVQKVMSYGLKLATLEEAKGLAIVLSSSTCGLQMNMERLIPRSSAARRTEILEILTDRLTVLKRRLGENEENELSVAVECELAAMLSTSTELTE